MRLGFILGFLIGAALASVLNSEQAEAPSEGAETVPPEPEEGIPKLVYGLRRKLQEALAAGREAAREKEDEMRQAYERSLHP